MIHKTSLGESFFCTLGSQQYRVTQLRAGALLKWNLVFLKKGNNFHKGVGSLKSYSFFCSLKKSKAWPSKWTPAPFLASLKSKLCSLEKEVLCNKMHLVVIWEADLPKDSYKGKPVELYKELRVSQHRLIHSKMIL